MVRKISLTEQVDWVSNCFEMNEAHMHQSQYLLEMDGNHVLIDAGSEEPEETTNIIKSIIEDDNIDAILLTHSILPHTKNLSSFENEWNEMEIISAARSPGMVGLSDKTKPKILNNTIKIANQTFTFMDPVLTDVVLSNWIYSHDHKILFTAEGVGHFHAANDCEYISSEIENSISFKYIHQFHKDKLPYLEFVNPTKLREAFETILNAYDIEYIAPIHGNPIGKNDIKLYLDKVIKSSGSF